MLKRIGLKRVCQIVLFLVGYCNGETLDEKLEIMNEYTNNIENVYKHARLCISEIIKYTYSIPSLGELLDHYHDLLKVTQQFRNIPYHNQSNYAGPWIENYFIQHFENKSLLYFGGFVPLFVQWVDYEVYTGQQKLSAFDMFRSLYSVLRRDIIYITVSQHNRGIRVLLDQFPNVIIISAGGNGHIPIPLIKDELNLTSYTSSDKYFTTDLGFYGTVNHGARRTEIFKELSSLLKTSKLSHYFGLSPSWKLNISHTIFNLAPRGHGRTSFRLAEIIQLGRIPIYIYDDYPWLPYEGTNLSIREIGYVGHAGSLSSLINKLENVNDEELEFKLNKVFQVRSAYTYSGVIKLIESFFAHPFSLTQTLKCVKLVPLRSKTLAASMDLLYIR